MTEDATVADPDALEALAGRLEGGESGWEIDRAVVMVAFPESGEPAKHCVDDDEPIFWRGPYYKQPVPNLSTSLDACEALRVRVLPEAFWGGIVQHAGREYFVAEVCEGGAIGRGRAPTEPAARLAAILRALAAKIREERGDG